MLDLVKWNPGRSLFHRHPAFSLFDDFFAPTRRDERSASIWSWNPAVDVIDNDDHIEIKAELPGVEKENLDVDIKDRVLTLKGERRDDREVKEERYYRRERSYGRFERSFTLPAGVDPEKIEANYRDGVLHITAPKSEQSKPRQISVH